MNKELESLQNFADHFGMEVREWIFEDKRKKQKYFLVKDGSSISPAFSYEELNVFMLGASRAIENKLSYEKRY